MMNKTSAVETVPQQDKDYATALDRYLIEIEHHRSDMAESQHRIERLREETSDMMAETRQLILRLAA